ncbi:MAG: haloacid dehalogenase-like hydrolase, partial [Erysipelotrichaceae bacterium]|nr:haloacid dehalogenase-like hydrolase [Erysipelotrichaceae bacterium]
ELAASMGADIIILNLFDTDNPVIKGLPECAEADRVRLLKKLTGRPIGINLEPAEIKENTDSVWAMTNSRRASGENARKARDMGIDMIVVTGNPGNGVSNEGIIKALKEMRDAAGDDIILVAGKMHASGILKEGAEAILTMQEIDDFVEAGADIILMPAPGTVPGIDLEWVRKRVARVHELGKLTETAIGTSQEGADIQTIRQIALLAKQSGTDIHHIGDSGYLGMALPENIMAYSIAVRGIRHTYHRMAGSVNR